MTKINVLIEVKAQQQHAFSEYSLMSGSESEKIRESEKYLADISGLGLEITGESAPIPMFALNKGEQQMTLSSFGSTTESEDLSSSSMVISGQISTSHLEELGKKDNITVWSNSPIELYSQWKEEIRHEFATHLFDVASSSAGIDCRPFRDGVSISTIRSLLGVEPIWDQGFRGQNIVVGIVDEGVNGDVYPVVGGSSKTKGKTGSAPITSHGSMCAADFLIAAPAAKIYDYPFIGAQNSGGVLGMFQEILDQRRKDGTPHLTNNSYGFVSVPPKNIAPNSEIWNIDHPIHRKVKELVASGISMFFAAGNCGTPCAASNCYESSIGSGKSIHASNSLQEVITVSAVNSCHERIGYSSQGPGMFYQEKPDIAAYSHIFGNFGAGRPAGTQHAKYDDGTSAATPVAAGVGALLLSAYPELTPQNLKDILIKGAYNIGKTGWDTEMGHGVINAGASYNLLKRKIFEEISRSQQRS